MKHLLTWTKKLIVYNLRGKILNYLKIIRGEVARNTLLINNGVIKYLSLFEGSVKAVRENLVDPPGRKPQEDLLIISQWYKNMNEKDKAKVEQIIRRSVRMAVFGFLGVLDGISAIEEGDKGTLKLYYERREESLLINDQHKAPLHELL